MGLRHGEAAVMLAEKVYNKPFYGCWKGRLSPYKPNHRLSLPTPRQPAKMTWEKAGLATPA